MEQAVETGTEISSGGSLCDRCGKVLRQGAAFAFKAKPIHGAPDQAAETKKCLFCALRHKPMMKRSVVAAAVVGTALTLLNQGDTLISAQWNNALYWKIPLTYCVPFLVASYGALTNSRK